MASITERDGTFYIRVFCGKTADGKQVVKRTTYTPTATTPAKIQKEVQKYAQQFEEQVKSGQYLEGEKLTFSSYVDTWAKEWGEDHLSERTLFDYKKLIQKHCVPAFGHLKISGIRPAHVQALLTSLKKEGLSPASINKVLVACNSVFRHAYRLNIIQENPCDRVERLKLNSNDTLHYFTVDQTKRFLGALTKSYKTEYKERHRTDSSGNVYTIKPYNTNRAIPKMFQAYFYIAVYGGFRRSEIIALTWSDIDFDNHTVSITKAVEWVKGTGQYLKETKTPAAIREIVLPEICFKILREWRLEEMHLIMNLGTAWKGASHNIDDNFIFIQPDNGLMMDLNTPYHKFHEIIDTYNASLSKDEADLMLPKIRLHDLRHTSATLLISEGCDIETVAKRLGHSKPSTTMDIYGHALPEKDRTAADTLSNLLHEAQEGIGWISSV